MSHWTELAVWRGPTPNHTAGHKECRGLVLHIAEGFYEGTISWQMGPDNNVSSHFVIDRDGTIAQMVDTDDTAWTQILGNGHWLSAEFAGFTSGNPLHAQHPGWEQLSAAQVEAAARLLLRGHQQYGYPLQLATSPSGMGLGHHSMGAESGVNWGHSDCPGEPIKAQKPAILARAQQLAGGAPAVTPTTSEDTMGVIAKDSAGQLYHCVGGFSHPITAAQAGDIRYLAKQGAYQLATGPGNNTEWTDGGATRLGWSPGVFGPVWTPSAAAAVDPAALNAAVKTALSDPAVLAGVAKAINDDAAKRLAS